MFPVLFTVCGFITVYGHMGNIVETLGKLEKLEGQWHQGVDPGSQVPSAALCQSFELNN